jgi:hypothetical protein
MGGRGKSSTTTTQAPEMIERDYEIISRESLQGRATYAFLEKLGLNWTVLTSPANQPGNYHPQDVFGMEAPSLRWVNGDQIVDLFVDGLSTEAFLARSGLELSLHKGGFVLSKRLSRILRPQYVTAFFDVAEVYIQYMDLDDIGVKVWDGAGLISRSMLERMIAELPDVSESKRAQLIREIKHGQRVEFTIMTENGQDKGHCIVSDTLQSDFLLPQDTKREVKLVNGQTFVGINFVHGHADMRLDIQSLINLYPFFEEQQLEKWLHDEGELFIHSIETGDVGAAMARIDRFTTIEDVQSWPLREYLASGGDPMWFASHVKSFANQHLERLNYATLGKMRFPIPGGRQYVMPVGVGQQAGLDVQVGRGEIYIDPQHSTAWVNDEDWVQLQDAREGIAGILGGADNDDALWLHPFEDYDGERKVLAWRSPNQAGEYVILKPTMNSDDLAWQSLDGQITYPKADSRKLMARIDTLQPDYLNLVNPFTAGGLGEGQGYSVNVMQAAIDRAIANQGALGAYCNSLMLSKALYGTLPNQPPAPLEAVIDGSVKLGTDLSPILAWTRAAATKILEQRKPIPELLQGRLGSVPPGTPSPKKSFNHWLDRLQAIVKQHIQTISEKRDALVRQTMPPRAIFDHTFAQSETIALGAKLNQVYTSTIKQIAKNKSELTQEDYDAARHTAEQYLHNFPNDMQTSILRGAIVSAYLRNEPGSDAALWLAGAKIEGGRKSSIGQQTVQALREVGVLDEIANIDGRVTTYPGASASEPAYRTIGINGVWQNIFQRWAAHNNHNPDETKSPEAHQAIRWAKQRVSQMLENGQSVHLHVREEELNGQLRKIVYDTQGNRFGTISRDSQHEVGASFILRFALAHDGNLRAVIDDSADEIQD